MPSVFLGLFVSTVCLSLMAAPLRHRVTLVQSPHQLQLYHVHAAVRLDALLLITGLLWVVAALVTRAPVIVLFGVGLMALASGRLLAARWEHDIVFDRAGN